MRWRAALNVTNLFNKLYVVSARGDNRVRYGDPVLVTASLGYRF